MLSPATGFSGQTLPRHSCIGMFFFSASREYLLHKALPERREPMCFSCASKESRLKTYCSICGVFPLQHPAIGNKLAFHTWACRVRHLSSFEVPQNYS
jgi:hypothetical protein